MSQANWIWGLGRRVGSLIWPQFDDENYFHYEDVDEDNDEGEEDEDDDDEEEEEDEHTFQILGRLGFNVQITIKSTIDHSTVEKAPRLGIRIVFLIFPSDTIWWLLLIYL